MMDKPIDIDAYIANFPEATQKKLSQMRTIIHEAAPNAIEVISYAIPAFKQHGVLVYFAGYTNHIGFYPTGSGIAAFQTEITMYKSSKGAIQFPLDQPLPVDLIKKIVHFRVKADTEKALLKKK